LKTTRDALVALAGAIWVLVAAEKLLRVAVVALAVPELPATVTGIPSASCVSTEARKFAVDRLEAICGNCDMVLRVVIIKQLRWLV
jgi:hypothetical protein